MKHVEELASKLDTPASYPPTAGHAKPATAWDRRLAMLHYCLTRERRIPTRQLKLTAALLVALATLIVALAPLTPAPRFFLGRGGDHIVLSQYHPLRRASDWLSHRQYAVLTFDDGPEGNGVDEEILSVLRRHHARAMFFLVCNRIDDHTNTIVRNFESEGHIIGNHSFDHLALSREPSSRLTHQIEECSRQISKVTGHRPRYFRPPFGMTSSSVAQSAKDSGMQQVLWNANSYDVLTKNPKEIVRHTSAQADDASIILMHEREVTASALDRILTHLEQRGFTFVLPEDNSPQDVAS